MENFDFKSTWDPDARLKCPIERNGDSFLSTFSNSRDPEGTDKPETPTKPFTRVLKKRKRRIMRRQKRDGYSVQSPEKCNIV